MGFEYARSEGWETCYSLRCLCLAIESVAMSKAFTRENDDEDDELESSLKLPAGVKNYITPQGQKRLHDELEDLWKVERPILVKTITWAASNGDRSENGDYIYGKKRLREIDKRIRFLRRRLDLSEVVDPAQRKQCEQVFFSATVTVCDEQGVENTYSIVGVDEADVARGRISWVSPLAMALLKLREGEVATLRTPTGVSELEVLKVCYVELD
jgi:transcription elongation factor GreB